MSLEDLSDFDYQIYKSIAYLVKSNKMDDLTLQDFTFVVMNESGEEVELLQGGREMRLTKDNREIYGNLMAAYYLRDDIRDEMRAFTEGFHDVIPLNIISAFDEDELELLIGGTPYIDIHDWRTNTLYSGDFHERHPVVLWFWELLEKLS